MQAEVTGIISSTTQLRTAIQLALVKEQQAVPGVALGMEIQASHVGSTVFEQAVGLGRP